MVFVLADLTRSALIFSFGFFLVFLYLSLCPFRNQRMGWVESRSIWQSRPGLATSCHFLFVIRIIVDGRLDLPELSLICQLFSFLELGQFRLFSILLGGID